MDMELPALAGRDGKVRKIAPLGRDNKKSVVVAELAHNESSWREDRVILIPRVNQIPAETGVATGLAAG